MKERRKLQRTQPNCDLWLVDRNTDEPIGRVLDFTTEGIRLSADHPIEQGTVHQCQLIVPVSVSATGTIDFDAKCLWGRPSGDGKEHHIGLELLNVVRDQIERLKQLMAEPAKQH